MKDVLEKAAIDRPWKGYSTELECCFLAPPATGASSVRRLRNRAPKVLQSAM